MTIADVVLTVKETDAILVKHVETTLIRGPTVQLQLIEIGGADIQSQAGIVEGCNQTKG